MSIELKYGPALSGKQHRVIHTSSTADQILVTGNLNPSSNVTYQLGNSVARWKSGYFRDIDLIGNVIVDTIAVPLSTNNLVDHGTVSVLAGEGLTGGGDITTTRTLSMDIDSLTANAAPDGTSDYVVVYDFSAGDHKKVLLNDLPNASGGETNTASNAGSAGVGVFLQKTGTNLEFKNINTNGNELSITDDTANAEIDINLNVGNVDHDQLLNYLPNEHIDHSTVSVTGTNGISGGGFIVSNVQLSLDIDSLTQDLTPDNAADFVATYDTSTGQHKKVLLEELGRTIVAQNVNTSGTGVFRQKVGDTLQFRGVGAASSRISTVVSGNTILIDAVEGDIRHDFLDGWEAFRHISHADVHIIAGNGLSGGGDILANVTLDLDINELTANTVPDGATDYVVVYDASAGDHKKVLLNNLPSSGGGEINTASNVGSAGVGVFKQKSGTNLEFKNINTSGNQISIIDDTGNSEIDVNLNVGNVDHDQLLNYVANEHIDHSLVYVVAGEGLSGTANLLGNVTLDMDINGLMEENTANLDTDYIVFYDSDATMHKKLLMANIPPPTELSVYYHDSADKDSFSRLRVSNPVALYSATVLQDTLPTTMELISSGTGAAPVLNSNQRVADLVVAAGTGTSAMQTYEYTHYQPGKSHFIFVTFVMGAAVANSTMRVGYFDANNGIFLERDGSGTVSFVRRTSTSGSVVDNKVAQASWNVDTFAALDLSKSQILVIDLQFLGVGRVRCGFDVDGVIKYCHYFNNANNLTVPYMQTASLPIRISNVTASSGVSSTLKFKCTSVSSEGGNDLVAGSRFFSTGSATVTAGNGARTLIMTLRPRTAGIGGFTSRSCIRLNKINILVTGSRPVFWELCVGGTMTPGAFTNVSTTYSNFEWASGGTYTNLTGGLVIDSGFVGAGNNVLFSVASDISLSNPCSLNASGANTALTTYYLLVQGVGGTSATYCSMSFVEML